MIGLALCDVCYFICFVTCLSGLGVCWLVGRWFCWFSGLALDLRKALLRVCFVDWPLAGFGFCFFLALGFVQVDFVGGFILVLVCLYVDFVRLLVATFVIDLF